MTSVVRTRRVAAPADDVWAALADFGAIARWAPNVDHSCLMSATAPGVGSTRRVQTGRITLVERIIEWSPPSVSSGGALAYRIEGLPPALKSVVNRWTVESGIDGSQESMVSLSSEVDAGPRPPQQVAARAVGRRLASAGEELLAGLDRHLTEGSER